MATAHKNETKANWQFAFFHDGTWAESIQELRCMIPEGEPLCFTEASFFRGNLTGVDLRGAHCERSDFSQATLVDAIFTQAKVEGSEFTFAYLDNADFSGADLKGATFSRVTLEGAKFTGADLHGCKFLAESYKGVDFTGATMTGVTFDEISYSALAEAKGWEHTRGLDPAIFNAIFNAGYVLLKDRAAVSNDSDETKAATT